MSADAIQPAAQFPQAIVEARDLHRHYQMGNVTVHALRGVNLVVDRGEFVAIMGPSGSGKSTLLHLLGGLDQATDGEILLGGRPLTPLADEALTVVRRQRVGIIFQFFNLLPTLTAAENVALPLLLDGRHDHRRVAELLALVGLANRHAHRPGQLSGGEQQRVAIARALVTEPLVVLADEPTGNLDSDAGGQILALLREACDRKRQTVLMVTHDPAAAAVADRVIRLYDGQLVP